MDDKRINIILDKSDSEDSKHVVIIREGQALKELAPKKVNIAGQIETPFYFYKLQRAMIKETGYLTVDRRDMVVSLYGDPTSEIGAEVKGTIEDNPDLVKFNINKDKMLTHEQMLKLLRINRFFFTDRQQYDKLMNMFANFKYSKQVNGEASKDFKGNSNNSKQINFKINDSDNSFIFKLTIPVFQGFKPETFNVDLLVDAEGQQTLFWLESLELLELQRKLVDDKINELLKIIDESFLVVEL